MNLIRNFDINIDLLFTLMQRPQIYSRSPHYIWTDDHVGQRMVDLHLDPDIDSASLKHSTISNQVQWISSRIGDPKGKSVLDIGCGPGLFCERFDDVGFEVTGVDFNAHSLSYARARAKENGKSIEYVLGDYVQQSFERSFDAITLINRDFSALTADERGLLLKKVRRHLKPGGKFVFDLMSERYFHRLAERSRFHLLDHDGFWAPGPHLVLERTHLFETERVQLDQYAVIERDGTVRDFHNWLTYYTEDDVERILVAAGFEIVEVNPYLSDEAYGDPEMNLGFVASKR